MWHVKPLFHTFSKEHKMLLTEACKSNKICQIKIGVNVYKGLVIFLTTTATTFILLRSITLTNTNTNTYFRYLRLGLSLRPIRGKCDSLADLDYAYALHCDGVQYVLGDYGTFEESMTVQKLLLVLLTLTTLPIVLVMKSFLKFRTSLRKILASVHGHMSVLMHKCQSHLVTKMVM
ncbi:UNVERIFIED_ORG: hypothetical protein [Escherichia phage CMSTMSU]